jgi:hypothetical protein
VHHLGDVITGTKAFAGALDDDEFDIGFFRTVWMASIRRSESSMLKAL